MVNVEPSEPPNYGKRIFIFTIALPDGHIKSTQSKLPWGALCWITSLCFKVSICTFFVGVKVLRMCIWRAKGYERTNVQIPLLFGYVEAGLHSRTHWNTPWSSGLPWTRSRQSAQSLPLLELFTCTAWHAQGRSLTARFFSVSCLPLYGNKRLQSEIRRDCPTLTIITQQVTTLDFLKYIEVDTEH